MDFLQSVLSYIEGYEYLAYFLVFFFAASEATIGMSMLLPGSLFVMTLGALAAFDAFKIYYVIPIAILGAVLGDNISYFLGSKFGRKLLERLKFIDVKTIKAAEDFINRHGAKSVALGRFVPFVKETIPFVAGSLRMNRKKFFLFNVLGAFGWAFMWPGTGYIFAKAVISGEKWVSFLQLGIAFLIFAYLVYLFSSEFILKQYNINPGAYIQKVLRSKRLFKYLIYIFFAYAAFVALAIAVLESKPSVKIMDNIGFEYIYLKFNEFLFAFFKIFTWSAKWYILFAAFLILSFIYYKKYWSYIVSFFVGFFAVSAAVHFLKHSISRIRPEYMRVAEDGYAFPSGHAALATFVALFVIYFFVKSKYKNKYFYIALAFIWAILIYVSRIYLGVHYMSDILGGIIVAVIFAILAIATHMYLEQGPLKSRNIQNVSLKNYNVNNNKLMKIYSTAFENNSFIPSKYTCDGENINPEIIIENIPSDAKSLVLIMDDPDVPYEVREDRHFTHWLLYNIPAKSEKLVIPENNTQYTLGVNDAGTLSYVGPCPPTNFEPTEHRYFFKVYALNQELNLPEGLTQSELEKTIQDYVIAQAELMGRYDRNK